MTTEAPVPPLTDHNSSAQPASSRPLEQSIGLALSGGGFRATLFHLGVVRYLYDVKQLENVAHISAVSGGSILAAHLVLNWNQACTDFNSFSDRLLRFIASDVRGRIMRRWPLISLVNWIPGLWWLTTSYLLERYYSRELYSKQTLSALSPKQGEPTVHFLVTSLSYPEEPAAFTEEGFENFVEDGRVETGRPPIGRAVAASSAIPVLFPPVKVNASALHVRERRMHYPQQYVTDGGVYDNLGLRPIRMKLASIGNLSLVLSDAGGISDWSPKQTFRTMSSALGRVIDVLFDRIRRLEEESAAGDKLPGREICSISIHKAYKSDPGDWFTADVQRNLPIIRTDLDQFSPEEIRALVLHGQLAARKELSAAFGIEPPEGYRRWEPLATDTPFGPELLDNSSARKPRIWAPDRIYLLYLLLFILVIGGGWYLNRVRPETIYSNLESSPFFVQPQNEGFTIKKRTVSIDLTHEKVVPPERRDASHLNPSVHEIKLDVVKGETDPRYLVYEIVSQRRLADIACTSGHPYEVRYRRQGGIAGKGLDNVWTIIIDTGHHLPNIPFSVSYRLVRFNAYQAQSKNWVGVKVEGNEELVETNVTLPAGKTLVQPPEIVERRVSSEEEHPFSGSTLVEAADKHSFQWTVPKPAKGWIYKAYMDWTP